MMLFKTYRNNLNKITKLSKANYYGKVWEGIKEIINIKKNSPKIQNINNNRKLITNHKIIANTFNNVFVDVPKAIDNNMVKRHKKYQDYLCNPVVNTFHLDPTTKEKVQSKDP